MIVSVLTIDGENLHWFWAKATMKANQRYGSTGESFSRLELSGQQVAREPEDALAKTVDSVADKAAGRIFSEITSGRLSND